MAIYALDPRGKKLRKALFAVLILFVIAFGFVGAGLALGTEPRLVRERSRPGTFRVTGSSYFTGFRYHSKTVEVVVSSAARDRSSDSLREKQRWQSLKSLDLYGADRRRIARMISG